MSVPAAQPAQPSPTGIVIDAGPALTFLARKDTTRILFQGIYGNQLQAPEIVQDEVLRHKDQRFRTCASQWSKLVQAQRIEVLSDSETAALDVAVQRLEKMPLSQRKRDKKDFGELMVIAHAVVTAEQGHAVTILIQEARGTHVAQAEQRRIARLPGAGPLRVWSTPTVLLRAAGSEYLPDQAEMRSVYAHMATLDLALAADRRVRGP